MIGPAGIRHHKKMLRKWFGANRGTHWTIAGSVAVIIFGSYLIYSSRGSNLTIATASPAAGRNTAPMTPGPFPLKK
jgi:hypothetical protein